MPRCYLCGSEDSRLVTDRVRFGREANVHECRACSLVYLDQNSFQFPKDFYETEYHQTYLTHVEPDALDPKKYYEKMLQTVRPWSDRINSMLTGSEKVLDVGCSTGHLITNISARAGEVHGHEISRKEVEFCRNVLKLSVSDEPLEKRFATGTFDYITMIFVLEHIADPISFLKHLGKFLKPSGKFVILVPNVNDPLVGFYDIPACREFYYCIEHLYYYTPQTLGALLKRAGLEGRIEAVQEYPIANHLNWGYLGKPSDVLASRRIAPNVPIRDGKSAAFEKFWEETNARYRSFLVEQGHADRVWAVAESTGSAR